jgi:hypothetical protein
VQWYASADPVIGADRLGSVGALDDHTGRALKYHEKDSLTRLVSKSLHHRECSLSKAGLEIVLTEYRRRVITQTPSWRVATIEYQPSCLVQCLKGAINGGLRQAEHTSQFRHSDRLLLGDAFKHGQGR